METETNEKTTRKYEKKKLCRNIQLNLESAKLLSTLHESVNKKQFGRQIRNFEIVAKSLKLLSKEHIIELQNQSLREKDKLNLAYNEYQEKHGKISLDEFIGKLLEKNQF